MPVCQSDRAAAFNLKFHERKALKHLHLHAAALGEINGVGGLTMSKLAAAGLAEKIEADPSVQVFRLTSEGLRMRAVLEELGWFPT